MTRISVKMAGCAAIIGVASTTAGAAQLLLSFDAAAAGPGVTPTGVSPAWTFSGANGGAQMANNGSFLLQDQTSVAGQQSSEYLSPTLPAGTFTLGGDDYGIEFKVRPLTDLQFIGPHWPELYLTWSDNDSNYNISVDRFGNSNTSGTGDIVYGRNSFNPAITGIDWSQPHTIFIGHRGDGTSSVFDFYLDGALVSTRTYGSIARPGSYARDAVGFGDGTTGGTDVAAEWYFVRVYDVNNPALVPEPAGLALCGAGLFIAAFRRRG